MKVVTASNGKKTVKISKSEWETIGKKHGWMKKAERKYISVQDAPQFGNYEKNWSCPHCGHNLKPYQDGDGVPVGLECPSCMGEVNEALLNVEIPTRDNTPLPQNNRQKLSPKPSFNPQTQM